MGLGFQAESPGAMLEGTETCWASLWRLQSLTQVPASQRFRTALPGRSACFGHTAARHCKGMGPP